MTEQQQEHTPATAPVAPAPAAEAPPKNPLLRHADFIFPTADIDPKIDTRLLQQQGKVSLPGFRRGKVPVSVMRQRFGKDTLHEILQQECGVKFQEKLKEENERAAAQPELHLPDIATDGQYRVHCHYEIIPEIAAPDLSGKELKNPIFSVTDNVVDEMVEILRKQRGTYAVTEGAVEDNDYRLRVDFSSVLLEADGENKGNVVEEGKDKVIVLADKTLRPELKETLQGARVGDKRTAELPMPEGGDNPQMQGRVIAMELTVNSIEKLEKAELNEEFFGAFGDEEKTLEAFRKSVQEHLQRESKIRLRNFLHTRAMNLLIDATPEFALPQAMLINECHRLMHTAQAQWKERGSPETAAQLSLPMFYNDAERRVKLGLILSAWQQREKPEIGKEDIDGRLQEIVSAYEDPAAMATQLRSNQNEMEAVYLSILEDRITDWVLANCTSSDEAEMTLSDFLNEQAT